MVVYLLFWSGPKLRIVASSFSGGLLLYPSWAGPCPQALSSKLGESQVVPKLAPVSRYFQTAPVATRVTGPTPVNVTLTGAEVPSASRLSVATARRLNVPTRALVHEKL